MLSLSQVQDATQSPPNLDSLCNKYCEESLLYNFGLNINAQAQEKIRLERRWTYFVKSSIR